MVRAYQVLATLVGINLIFVISAWQGQLWTSPASWWNRHDTLIFTIDQIHGLLFMALLVVIVLLARRFRFSPWFTVSTALLATIPLVSFWAERRTTRAVSQPS